VGGARVSEVHGNFIVNEGAATANEVLELIGQIQARARESAGSNWKPKCKLWAKKHEDALSILSFRPGEARRGSHSRNRGLRPTATHGLQLSGPFAICAAQDNNALLLSEIGQ